MTPLLQYSLDEAKAEGMHIGRLEGKEEGREEGREEERRQVIANMFRKNVDIPFIAKVTGVSEAEIKKLQKDNPHK